MQSSAQVLYTLRYSITAGLLQAIGSVFAKLAFSGDSAVAETSRDLCTTFLESDNIMASFLSSERTCSLVRYGESEEDYHRIQNDNL